jgi:hypothetical protein
LIQLQHAFVSFFNLKIVNGQIKKTCIGESPFVLVILCVLKYWIILSKQKKSGGLKMLELEEIEFTIFLQRMILFQSEAIEKSQMILSV